MSMKEYLDIINEDVCERPDFEIFRSNVCHFLKNKGDMRFIIYILQNDYVRKYWVREWYPESLYLLAALDYLCRENGMPLCEDYDDIRKYSLDEIIYPKDIMVLSMVSPGLDKREEYCQRAIPEFMRFNIAEGDIRDVC